MLAGVATTVSRAQEPANPASGGSAQTQAKAASSSPEQRVVLKVGNVQVTEADFESMVKSLEEQQGPADLSRQAIGENYASLLMLSQQAVANHLDSSPQVVRQLALDRTQILSNAEYARLKEQAAPTPAEISEYYSAHLADYDKVDVRRLFIWKKGEGGKAVEGLSPEDAQALADAIRRAYAMGGNAKKLLQDNKNAVLDLEPITFQRGELPPKMEQAAFATKAGEWAEIDNGPGNLVLLQVIKFGRLDLKEVSSQIAKILQAQKLRAELDELKKQAGVWMDEKYFAPAPKTSVSGTQPKTSAPGKSDKREGNNENK